MNSFNESVSDMATGIFILAFTFALFFIVGLIVTLLIYIVSGLIALIRREIQYQSLRVEAGDVYDDIERELGADYNGADVLTSVFGVPPSSSPAAAANPQNSVAHTIFGVEVGSGV